VQEEIFSEVCDQHEVAAAISENESSDTALDRAIAPQAGIVAPCRASPMPPDPIGAAMTYGPSRVPAAIIDARPFAHPFLGKAVNPSCCGKPA
jgi:hypothetical protein